MKKVFSIILLVLIFIVLIFNIVSIFEFSFFGFRIFKVATGSMEPTITVNSIIVVKETNDINVGDIITYRDSNGYTTHRIVEKTEETITTKGDANNVSDDPITTESVIGKVVLYINIFGFIAYLLQNPIMWFLLLLIGILVLFIIPVKIPHLKKIKKEEKKEIDNIEEKIEEIVSEEKAKKQEKVDNKKILKETEKTEEKPIRKNRFSKYY